MAGVRTLDGRTMRIPATASRVEKTPRGTAPAPDPDAGARASLRSLVAEGVRFEVSDDGRHLEGRRIDLDPRELRRLRRGEHAVDGRLDLHGMSVPEAREALEAFVRKRQAEGDRVIEVIHGKGTHSPRGIAVLRGEIAAWLSQGRASRHVAAFTSLPYGDGAARDREEGAGALLVLLAR
jgi:DNA-nicking Smr family endonuclease